MPVFHRPCDLGDLADAAVVGAVDRLAGPRRCRKDLARRGSVAAFSAKLHNRLLRPLLAADQSQAPPEFRAALQAITRPVDAYVDRARLSQAALNLTRSSRTGDRRNVSCTPAGWRQRTAFCS